MQTLGFQGRAHGAGCKDDSLTRQRTQRVNLTPPFRGLNTHNLYNENNLSFASFVPQFYFQCASKQLDGQTKLII